MVIKGNIAKLPDCRPTAHVLLVGLQAPVSLQSSVSSDEVYRRRQQEDLGQTQKWMRGTPCNWLTPAPTAVGATSPLQGAGTATTRAGRELMLKERHTQSDQRHGIQGKPVWGAQGSPWNSARRCTAVYPALASAILTGGHLLPSGRLLMKQPPS